MRNTPDKTKKLEEKVEFYEFILDNIEAGVWVNTYEGMIYNNRKSQEEIGFTAKELNEYGDERYRTENYHPDDKDIWENSYKHLMENGNATTIYRQKDKNGDWIKILGVSKLVKKEHTECKTVNCGIVISNTMANFTKIEELLRENAYLKNKLKFEKITKREKEVLKLICEGLTGKQIANELFISTHTVESHRKNIMKKMNTSNIAELIQLVSTTGQ